MKIMHAVSSPCLSKSTAWSPQLPPPLTGCFKNVTVVLQADRAKPGSHASVLIIGIFVDDYNLLFVLLLGRKGSLCGRCGILLFRAELVRARVGLQLACRRLPFQKNRPQPRHEANDGCALRGLAPFIPSRHNCRCLLHGRPVRNGFHASHAGHSNVLRRVRNEDTHFGRKLLCVDQL